jgi:hypothetical protein
MDNKYDLKPYKPKPKVITCANDITDYANRRIISFGDDTLIGIPFTTFYSAPIDEIQDILDFFAKKGLFVFELDKADGSLSVSFKEASVDEG